MKEETRAAVVFMMDVEGGEGEEECGSGGGESRFLAVAVAVAVEAEAETERQSNSLGGVSGQMVIRRCGQVDGGC